MSLHWNRRAAIAAAMSLLLAILGAAPMLAAEGTGLAGHWDGEIQIPGTKLGVDLDFTAGEAEAWKGDISIPLQNAKDLPLINIKAEDTAVSFEIQGVPGTPKFNGTLSADGAKIAGDFTQSGQKFPFELRRGAAPADVAKEALAGYDELVEKMIQDFRVPGLAVAIVKGGEVIYAKGFGYRDVEKKLPVTPDTLFAIGSSTKAFTTFALATLVDEGKLDWDKPVKDFLPGFQMYDPDTTALITPRDLVTHRSGLPRHDLVWYNNKSLTRKSVVERLRYLEPNEQLRAKFQYNNLMFITAGYLTEHLTGKSWEDNIRDRIFLPLGISNSNFSTLDSQKGSDFAQPYREEDDEKIILIPFREVGQAGPAGSINSSVNNMAKWVTVNLSGGKVDGKPLIGASTLADLHAPHMLIDGEPERPELSRRSYGLGWFIDTYRGHPRVYHGGNIDGFSALVTLLPKDDLGMVVLTNKDSTGVPERLVRHTVDRMLKLDPIDWNGEALAQREKAKGADKESEAKEESVRKEGTKPAHKLAEYAGEYEHPAYGTAKVSVVGNHLELTFNDIKTPLEHWHYEVWNGGKGTDPTFEDSKFMFQGDMKGNVVALSAQFEPQVKDIVFAKKPDARLSDPAYLARFTGEYDLAGQTVTISLAGSTLQFSLPGQPELHLMPGPGGELVVKEFPAISISFQEDANGNIISALLKQPQNVYTLTKKK